MERNIEIDKMTVSMFSGPLARPSRPKKHREAGTNMVKLYKNQILEAGSRGEKVSLKGIIVPGDPDERLNTAAIVLSTDMELDFVIERNAKGDELFDHLRDTVRVRGFIREDEQGRSIRITDFEIL